MPLKKGKGTKKIILHYSDMVPNKPPRALTFALRLTKKGKKR